MSGDANAPPPLAAKTGSYTPGTRRAARRAADLARDLSVGQRADAERTDLRRGQRVELFAHRA